MSVFRVKLNNIEQGRLDMNPATGMPFATSVQRTAYVTGPGHSYRELRDGEVFTDNNYWKRFAYPQVSLADSFIEVVTDDGSVFSNVESENSFPRVYKLTVAGGSAYAVNVIDIVGDNGCAAMSADIVNKSAQGVKVKMNGLATAIFDLDGNEQQTFNHGDSMLTRLEFDNTSSGATTAIVQVILALKSKSMS